MQLQTNANITIVAAIPKRRPTLLGVCLCALLLVSIGCSPGKETTPVSFEGLCQLTLDEFASMDEETLVQWVEEKHGVSPSKSEQEWDGNLIVSYEWESDGVDWFASCREDRLSKILRLNVPLGPTFGEVVERLGSPERISSYATRVEDTGYQVALEYPEAGLTLGEQGWLRGYVTEVTLSKRQRVNSVLCYMPGPLEEIMQEVLLVSPEYIPVALERKVLWPGFGAKITLPP